MTVSLIVHGAAMGWDIRPAGLDLRDLDGEATIPIDLLTPESAPPQPPPAPATSPIVDPEASGIKPPGVLRDAGPVLPDRARDGGSVASSAAARDSGSDAMRDAGESESRDAAAPDPEAVAASMQQARPPIVVLINAEVIRKHPVGATMGRLLRGIPQWDDFMSGTSIDPVHDVDWVMISGPSLVNTERDDVLVHTSAPDAVIDRAIAVLARRYARGGSFDAGVPGLRATLAHADRAERVIFRPAAHLLAVVPPAQAHRLAVQLAGMRMKAPAAGDAVYWRFLGPHRLLRDVPESITEMRLRVVARANGGADIFAEGDTADPATASAAAEDFARFVRRRNDFLTSLVTHGLLGGAEITSEGRVVKAHVPATRDQVQAIVDLVAGLLGVDSPQETPPRAPGTVSSARTGEPAPFR